MKRRKNNNDKKKKKKKWRRKIVGKKITYTRKGMRVKMKTKYLKIEFQRNRRINTKAKNIILE